MDTNRRQRDGCKTDSPGKLTLDKIKSIGYSIVEGFHRFKFENTPRIYRISEGIYIRWRNLEYIIYKKDL